MKVLVDMNLSPKWAAELQSKGIESTHWQAIGEATAADEIVLAWCAANGHILFTHDLDFGAILAASKGLAPSVVQLRAEDVSPESMLGQVVNALRQAEADLVQGALITIEPARHRIRLLPLGPT